MQNVIHVQARAIIIKEDHIILCKTKGLSQNFYFLPGGHIEHGESAREALMRELKEEVGFEFSVSRFLGCMEYAFDPALTNHAYCHTQEYTFIFEAQSSNLPLPTVPLEQLEEKIEISWVLLRDLDKIDFRPNPLAKELKAWLGKDFNGAFLSSM